MKNYEIMMIVKPTLSEDETKKVVENFSKVVTENGKVEIRRTPAHTPTGKISRSMDYYKNTIKIRQK